MGMMDDKRYLTGTNGVLVAGDTFHLHSARIGGQVKTPNGMKPEAVLSISKDGTVAPITVYTTGAAIVGQVERMDAQDVERMSAPGGWPLVLSKIDTSNGEAHVLRPQDSPDPTPGESF